MLFFRCFYWFSMQIYSKKINYTNKKTYRNIRKTYTTYNICSWPIVGLAYSGNHNTEPGWG